MHCKNVPDITTKLTDMHRPDCNIYSGHIGNLKVFRNLDSITIMGSLAKFLNNENITRFTREKVERAIKKLELSLKVSLSTAIVTSVEVGVSLIVTEKPSEYLQLFGYLPRLTRHDYSKIAGLETVTFGTPTGSYQFTGYDKQKEALNHKRQIVPVEFEGVNILRLEYRIARRTGIKAKFHADLTAYQLFDPTVYETLRSLFFAKYEEVPKLGRQYLSAISGKMTPVKWTELLAEQYWQNFPKQCQALLQELKASGALSEKNLERIRANNRKRQHEYVTVDKSPLIAELDGYIADLRSDIR
jgi:hypothetical protein